MPACCILGSIPSLYFRDVCFLGAGGGRGDEKQSQSWDLGQRWQLTRESSAERGSAPKRHVRHVSGGALRWGGREPGGWWCAGAHVAGGASAVLPADSAEQAGTNSPRLMCLLSGINSHSSGWESGGRAAASPITSGLVIFFFRQSAQTMEPRRASQWMGLYVLGVLNFILSGRTPPFG